MKRKKGALFNCDVCHARSIPMEWGDGFGWVCAICESGIWGPNQTPTVDGQKPELEEPQKDLFG